MLLNRFKEEEQVYKGINIAEVININALKANIPPKFLYFINLLFLPLFSLRLKVKAPIIYLRNLLLKQGLCNRLKGVIIKLL